MNIHSWFCKHKWKRICCEKILKRKSLKEFSNYDKISIPTPKFLEYEVLSETFVCEICGSIKHFVS